MTGGDTLKRMIMFVFAAALVLAGCYSGTTDTGGGGGGGSGRHEVSYYLSTRAISESFGPVTFKVLDGAGVTIAAASEQDDPCPNPACGWSAKFTVPDVDMYSFVVTYTNGMTHERKSSAYDISHADLEAQGWRVSA